MRIKRMGMAGAAVLVLVVAAVSVMPNGQHEALSDPASGSSDPASGSSDPAPGTSESPAGASPPGASGAPASAAAWGPARLDPPAFPLSPTWLPTGLGHRRVDLLGSNVLLRYEDGRGDVLSVETGPVAGGWEVEGEGDHRSTVGGAPATVRTSAGFDGARPGDRYVGVRWRADGRWVQVRSFGPRTERQVLRFARGLRPGGIPASPLPFELAEVPPGLTLSFVTADYLCLTPPPVTRATMQQGLCLGVEAAPAEARPGVELTVGGRPAVFTGPGELQVDLGGKRVLTVSSDQDAVGLSAEELVRFAAGVGVP